MSETDKNEPLQSPASTPDSITNDSRQNAPAKPVRQGGGKALLLLALLCGVAGIAVAGYSVWQVQQFAARDAQQAQALQSADAQAQRLAEADRQLANRLVPLEQLPSPAELNEQRRLLAALQSDQQRLSGRVEQVLGSSREEWRLAEAEHLLRMAMLRLSAMQDVKSAEMLVHEADLILQKQDDPAAYATRQKLLEGLEGLRSLPDLDRTGLFLQLGALRGQTSRLSALAPEFVNGEALPSDAVQSHWQRWLDELMRYVRIDFDAGTNVKPLLAGQSLAQVQLALSLAIEQAQWAVLNGNAEVYQQSLEQARSMLQDHFSEDNGDARGLRERIEALAGRQVAVTLPDLAPALKALQVYVQKRGTPDSGEPAPAQPAAETEQEAQRT